MSMQQCKVSPETARMLALGHPWVIADRHTRQWPGGKAGDVIRLVDERGRPLATALYEPGERVVARLLGGPKLEFGAELLRRRVDAALALRRRELDLEEVTAWRLVNGEVDGLPGVTVDCYGDYLMIQLYAGSWNPHLPLLQQVLEERLAPRGIYLKPRPQATRKLAARDDKRLSRLLCGTAAGPSLAVSEYDLTFLVNLEEGLDAGLFLDMRDHRRMLRGRLAGCSFLNLFAYTGAFSLAAAAGGATRVTSVDISAAYLERARANFSANGLDHERHAFIVDDCRTALEHLRRSGQRFDAILLDPPSFSTTREGVLRTRGGTAELVAACLQVLAPGGLLAAASNHQKTDLADYLKELRDGAVSAGVDLRVVGQSGQPADFPYPLGFPEGRYLKFVLCRRD